MRITLTNGTEASINLKRVLYVADASKGFGEPVCKIFFDREHHLLVKMTLDELLTKMRNSHADDR